MADVFHPLPGERLLPSSITMEAYRYLRGAIAAGYYAPGERIQEAAVAAQLNVSRTPVREALRALSADGLVEAVHGKGFLVRRFSLKEINDSYRARAFLEGEAAHDAAQRITPAELWSLEHCVSDSQRIAEAHPGSDADTVRVLTRTNIRFHELVLHASGSRILTQVVTQLMVRPLVYRGYYWYGAEDRTRSENYHEQILEAIRSHDAELARTLMVQHTGHIRDALMSALTRHPELLADEPVMPAILGPASIFDHDR